MTNRDQANAAELLFGLGIPDDRMRRAVQRIANALAGEREMTMRRLVAAMLKLSEIEL